jgi:hypothetical protein
VGLGGFAIREGTANGNLIRGVVAERAASPLESIMRFAGQSGKMASVDQAEAPCARFARDYRA